MGLEPTRSCDHRHLKPARLPIPPLLHISYCALISTLFNIQYFVINVNHYFKKNKQDFQGKCNTY